MNVASPYCTRPGLSEPWQHAAAKTDCKDTAVLFGKEPDIGIFVTVTDKAQILVYGQERDFPVANACRHSAVLLIQLQLVAFPGTVGSADGGFFPVAPGAFPIGIPVL